MLSFLPTDRIHHFLTKHFGRTTFTIKPMKAGLLNQNILVTAGREKQVLKIYRSEMTAEKVSEMHRLMHFAARHDIPVTIPIKTQSFDDHVLALYHFVNGEHPARYRNTHVRLESMGEMLGRIHNCLDEYKPKSKRLTPQSLVAIWNPTKSLQEAAVIRNGLNKQSTAVRREVNDLLNIHERILSDEAWDNRPFLKLPIAFCHGDYHIANILMRGSSIVSVLDWEKAGWNFRAFEVMRSIIFNCRKNASEFSWPHIASYLKGYRSQATLSDRECELAYECGLRNLAFSFWTIKQYLAGQKNLRTNIHRRLAMTKSMVSHRQEYAERIAALLK